MALKIVKVLPEGKTVGLVPGAQVQLDAVYADKLIAKGCVAEVSDGKKDKKAVSIGKK